MCRNIKVLYNFEAAFNRAVEKIANASSALLAALVTAAPPRNRAVESAKARARAAARFGA